MSNTTDMMTLEQAKQFTAELNKLLIKYDADLYGGCDGEIYIANASSVSKSFLIGGTDLNCQFDLESIEPDCE